MELWSWLLSAMGAASIWLAGSRRRVGWLVGLASEAVWVAYAVLTHQYGFILGAAVYGAVQWRNWRAWKPQRRVPLHGVPTEEFHYTDCGIAGGWPHPVGAHGQEGVQGE